MINERKTKIRSMRPARTVGRSIVESLTTIEYAENVTVVADEELAEHEHHEDKVSVELTPTETPYTDDVVDASPEVAPELEETPVEDEHHEDEEFEELESIRTESANSRPKMIRLLAQKGHDVNKLYKMTNKELYEMLSSSNKKATEPLKHAPDANAKVDSTLESIKAKIKAQRKKKVVTAKTESEEPKKVVKQHGTLSVCPICGSKEYDQLNEKCSVCGATAEQYKVIEAEDYEGESEATIIEVDGVDTIAIKPDGTTYIEQPDDLENHLEEDTHELVITDENSTEPETIQVDSGVLNVTDEESESSEAEQVAYLRIDLPYQEVADALMENNANRTDRVDVESGIILNVELNDKNIDLSNIEGESTDESEDEADAPVDVLESLKAKLRSRKEAEEPVADEDAPVDDEVAEPTDESDETEDVAEDESLELGIVLEELPEGTLVHADEIDSVSDLLDVVNYLLPDNQEIVDNVENESEDLENADLGTEEDGIEDAQSGDLVVTESGSYLIRRNGKLESFKGRTKMTRKTYESISVRKYESSSKSTKKATKESINVESGLLSALNTRKAVSKLLAIIDDEVDTLSDDKGTVISTLEATKAYHKLMESINEFTNSHDKIFNIKDLKVSSTDKSELE